MSYLSAFTNQMEAFCLELIEMFPEDSDLRTANNMIKILKKTNPRKLLSVFDNFTGGYKERILVRDESFFIEHNFDDIGEQTGYQEYTDTIVGRLKQHWKDMSDASKEATWLYFQVLFKLSDQLQSP
jgi:hypothetical protein